MMKKIFTYSVVLFSFLLVLQSCKKEGAVETRQVNEIINAVVAQGQTYSFTAPSVGTLNLSRQATHYTLSTVETGKDNGFSSYKYSPASGFSGADEVTLNLISEAIRTSSGGCQGNHNNNSYVTSTTYVIKINVTN